MLSAEEFKASLIVALGIDHHVYTYRIMYYVYTYIWLTSCYYNI